MGIGFCVAVFIGKAHKRSVIIEHARALIAVTVGSYPFVAFISEYGNKRV